MVITAMGSRTMLKNGERKIRNTKFKYFSTLVHHELIWLFLPFFPPHREFLARQEHAAQIMKYFGFMKLIKKTRQAKTWIDQNFEHCRCNDFHGDHSMYSRMDARSLTFTERISYYQLLDGVKTQSYCTRTCPSIHRPPSGKANISTFVDKISEFILNQLKIAL